MHKKLILIVLILIVVIFTCYSLYNNYYNIDITNYRYSFFAHRVKSPDKKHAMVITIYKENKESDIAYIMANIHKTSENRKSPVQAKTIFWQEVESDTLKYIDKDGTTYDYWVDNFWFNSETVSIKGIPLNINRDTYDYRRN